jgi:hypothetical protein
MRAVNLNGARAKIEVTRNLFVAVAFDEPLEDIAFPWRKPLDSLSAFGGRDRTGVSEKGRVGNL